MKRLSYIILFVVPLLFSGGCGEFLDVKPQGKVILTTEEEYSAIVHNLIHEIETGADQTIIGNFEWTVKLEAYSDNLDVKLHSVFKEGLPKYVGVNLSSLQTRYEYIYKVIAKCNIVTDELDGKISELAKNCVTAATAIKGICYYNLMREFCEPYDRDRAGEMLGVVLAKKYDIEASLERSTLKQTGELVVSLLKRAYDDGITNRAYVFNRDIMAAYLARTYFWMGDWNNAILYAAKVMENPEYELLEGDAYVQMMSERYMVAGNTLIRSYINEKGKNDFNYTLYAINAKQRPMSKEFFESFSPTDIRFGLSVDKKNRLNKKILWVGIRSDEMCLIMAESYAHLNLQDDALAMLNLLRSKRYSDHADYTLQTLPDVDAGYIIKRDAEGLPLTRLMYAILEERRKEFFMEGFRWFDLKRCGRPPMWYLDDARKYTTWEYLYTFPIPRKDLLLNDKLIQNPGYEEYNI